MPDPANYSSQDEFMADCVPMMVEEGNDQDQAVAACINMWENRGVKGVPVMTTRAYSVLKIKAVDEERREIEGVATTPTTDRIGDVIEPLGAKFALPVPLLWQHKHDQPVGEVVRAKAQADGIPFTARIARVTEPGRLKDRLDEVWQSVKHNLVRGVSIGFREREYSLLDDGGIRFMEWEWIELSLVTIPANIEATITSIKQYDRKAASGHAGGRDRTSPGATGTRATPKPVRLKTMTTKAFAEQISALENSRGAKSARQEEIMRKAAEENRSTDVAEQEEFDELEIEIRQLDGDLKRLRLLDERSKATAQPVTGTTPQAGSDSRASTVSGPIIRLAPEKLDPGIRFARMMRARWIAREDGEPFAETVRKLYPHDEIVQKAAVPAGTSASGSWAGFLVGDETGIVAEFLEYLRPMTIVGKFGTNGIPAMTRVPFRVPLLESTGAGDGYWVGEGAAKPLTSFSGSRTTLEPLKVANIAVATMELLRDSSPSAETWLRNQLVAALRARLDTDFINPAKTAVAGVSPASITNGVSLIASSGATADAVRTDISALLDAFVAANNPPSSGVWVMSTRSALRLGLMRNALGQAEFTTVNMMGGTLEGMPVISSEYVTHADVGSPPVSVANVYLVNANDIYLGDDGGFSVDVSREASLEMATDPSHAAATGSPLAPVETTLVSMFQTNSVAFRAERTINWKKARTSAVQGLSGVAWAPQAA